jgi:oligopeptide transport system ATP-binding protein
VRPGVDHESACHYAAVREDVVVKH